MVVNGAFKLTEHVANDHLTVVKNANYWDAANVKLDKVIFYPINDQAAAFAATKPANSTSTTTSRPTRSTACEAANADQVHVTPQLATYYYLFDTRTEPFNDVRVRQALSMAVDRDFLAEDIYTGTQLPSIRFVPPGSKTTASPPSRILPACPSLIARTRHWR